MKKLILYFSGTGNSLMVAKTIAKHLGDTDLLHFSKVNKHSLKRPVDVLGLVFPVYWNGLPLLVLNTLSVLKKLNPQYIFSVATHGGEPAQVLSQLQVELQKNGFELNAGICLEMPSNYILDYDAPSDSSIQSNLANAERVLKQFSEKIKSNQEYRPQADFPLYFGTTSDYQRFIATVHKSDSNFRVDKNCTECGLCEEICPVQNIRLEKGRPTWNHQCEQCLACINWCPEGSIQYKNQTAGRGRYANPRVSVDEMKI